MSYSKRVLVLVIGALFLMGSVSLAVAQQATQPAQKPADSGAAKPAAPATKAPAAKTLKLKGASVKSAIDDSLVVVAGKDKKEITFALSATTKIKKGGKAVTAKDLKEGDSVTVSYTEADGKMVAKSVTVAAPKVKEAAAPKK